jgi:hypothetical protein
MATCYHCLLHFNITKENGDGNKLPSPFSLQEHHKKKTMAHCHHLLLFCNTTTKKTLTHCCRLFLLKHRENKTHKKTTKKNQKKGRTLPSSSCCALFTFGSCFYPPTFALSFQVLSLDIFFFSSKRKEKKNTKGTLKLLLCPLTFDSCFCLPTFALSFQVLFLDIFFFLNRRIEKKNHREEKNAEKGRNLPFFFRFYIWDEALLLLSPLHIPSMLSSPPSSSLVSHISFKVLCYFKLGSSFEL